MGAREAPGGTSIICLRSTAVVGGTRVSTIVPRIGAGMTVTTPRHHVQWIVTEQGAVDVSLLGDRSRADALVALAHPDFRDELRAASGTCATGAESATWVAHRRPFVTARGIRRRVLPRIL